MWYLSFFSQIYFRNKIIKNPVSRLSLEFQPAPENAGTFTKSADMKE